MRVFVTSTGESRPDMGHEEGIGGGRGGCGLMENLMLTRTEQSDLGGGGGGTNADGTGTKRRAEEGARGDPTVVGTKME